jgi:hypothetical protein
MEELFEFLNELGKWSRGEREEKSQKGNSSHQLPLPIEWSLVIQWGWMSEAEEDDENEQEKPSWVVENGNEGHDSDSDEENSPTPLSKEGIGNVASI